MRNIRRASLALLSASALALSGCGLVSSGPYPNRAIEYFIPYNPGGGADPAGRQYTESLAEELDVSINVQNLPGGDEAIGISRLATADADGYTLGMGTSGGFVAQPIVNPDTRYDGVESFTPIAQMTSTPYGLFVSTDSEYETLDDLLDAARENPDEITVSAPVRNGSPALAVYLLEDMADVQFTLVTTSGGTGEAALEVMGGRIDAVIGNASGQVGLVESGDLRALGYTGDEDYSKYLPDTESFADQGYEIPLVSDYMTFAPKGLEPDIEELLVDTSVDILSSDKWTEWADNQGAIPMNRSGKELEEYLENTRVNIDRGLELAEERAPF